MLGGADGAREQVEAMSGGRRLAAVGLGVLLGAAVAWPAPAGPAVEVKTLLVRAEAAADEGRVTLTWRGAVRNPGGAEARVPVRLTARDSQWRPVAYFLVPEVAVGPGGRVQEEAVFEIEEALWRRIYTVDPQIVQE